MADDKTGDEIVHIDPLSSTTQEFANLDAYFAWANEQEQEALAGTHPEQRSITWGSHYVMAYGELMIFGYIPTLDELEVIEKGHGADNAEWRSERQGLLDSYERGYRFAKAYSAAEPEGEWGSVHISTCWPITSELFEAARARGWT